MARATTLQALERFSEDHRGWLFRGQRDARWGLETTLERASRRLGVDIKQYERCIVKEFPRHAHTFLDRTPKETDTLEWLALMQHYGAPTRLLDFTYSFWIALFFALEYADDDCVVWALNPRSLASNDSGSHHTGNEFNYVLRENVLRGGFADRSLYHDVPYYTNERLAIQNGTFVFSLNVDMTFQELMELNRKEYKKIVVGKDLIRPARRRLNEFNCNRRVLFPGIDGYAQYYQNHDVLPPEDGS